MLSIHSIAATDASGISGYYTKLAAKDDYYSATAGDKEPPGYWMGSGAQKLGCVGDLREGDLLRGLTGHHPLTGDAMANNAGNLHKPGWDCTFSAPKSVSAIWALADQELREKIEAAHRLAVAESVGYLERSATSTRHGKAGAVRRSINDSGGLIVAAYQHSTSRNQDPQLHTHALILNLSPDGRGIDIDISHKMVTGALYRCELAYQLTCLGLRIERDGKSFSVAGVPKSLLSQWSSRRAEIEDYLRLSGRSGAIESKRAALNTRADKRPIGQHTLRDRWASQALTHDFTAQNVRDLLRVERAHGDGDRILLSGNQIATELTVQNATFSRLQVLHFAAIDAQGILSVQKVLDRSTHLLDQDSGAINLGPVSRQQAAETYLKAGDRFTTQAVLDIEHEMLLTAQRLAHSQGFGLPPDSLRISAEGKGLSAQQISALAHVTGNQRAAVLEGWAGSGKSYLLAAARESWEAAGFEVRGVALSNAAAQNLQREAGIQSCSIAKFQSDVGGSRFMLHRTLVLVVDEAGMVGTRQTAKLIKQCDDSGAKIVLVGDTRQLQAIEAGAAMRSIAERIGKAELTQVRRQRNAIDREIARDFREGRAIEALDKLDMAGRLHVGINLEDARQIAVKATVADLQMSRSTLLLATTRNDVRLLNAEVRAQLKNAGLIDPSGVVALTHGGYREFSTGDSIVFGERASFTDKNGATQIVVNGSTGKVLRTAATDSSKELTVKIDATDAIVTLQVDGNQKIDHGYASTVHKAQGATVDCCHIVIGEAANRELSYVAASRHRENMHIYTTQELHVPSSNSAFNTSVATDLTIAMSRSQAKDMATDYHR